MTDTPKTEAEPVQRLVYDDDAPVPGEWVDCWNCGGDGHIEDDDPFWPADETCEICEGKGGWIYSGDNTDA